MNVTVLDRQPDTDTQSQLGFVDCDVHPYTKSPCRPGPVPVGALARAPPDDRRPLALAVQRNAPNYPRMSPVHRHAHRLLARRTAAIPAPTSS